jgi:hypothetical protein
MQHGHIGVCPALTSYLFIQENVIFRAAAKTFAGFNCCRQTAVSRHVYDTATVIIVSRDHLQSQLTALDGCFARVNLPIE